MSQRRPVVWVVYNDPHRNIDDSKRFGDPKYLFSGTVLYDRLVEHARRMLSGWMPGDYLLMVGDPTLCFVVGKIAAEMSEACGDGKVRVLRWGKFEARYDPYEFDFNGMPLGTVDEAIVTRKERYR